MSSSLTLSTTSSSSTTTSSCTSILRFRSFFSKSTRKQSIASSSSASISTTTEDTDASTVAFEHEEVQENSIREPGNSVLKKSVTFSPVDDIIACEPIHVEEHEESKGRSALPWSGLPRSLTKHLCQHNSRQSPASPSLLSGAANFVAQDVILYKACKKPLESMCYHVETKVQRSFHLSTFDFAKHLRHRKYVLRNLSFSTYPPQECVTLLDAGVDELLYSSLPPPALQSKPPASEIFVIKKVSRPSTGVGMFATVRIQNNQLISVEHPVIIQPSFFAIGHDFPSDPEMRALSEMMFARLGNGIRGKLVRETDRQRYSNFQLYDKIIRNNTFCLQLPVSQPWKKNAELPCHQMLFVNAGRINHSCSPNAVLEWNCKSYSASIRSCRTIQPGEEITIAYVQPELPYSERRRLLRHWPYGFDCTCSSCMKLQGKLIRSARENQSALSDITIRLHDTDRQLLGTYWKHPERILLRDWLINKTIPPKLLIKAHTRALGIIFREGLESLFTSPYKTYHHDSLFSLNYVDGSPLLDSRYQPDVVLHIDRIAICYAALADVDRFRYWLKAAAGRRVIPGDREHNENILVWYRKWHADPSTFPFWGYRRPRSI